MSEAFPDRTEPMFLLRATEACASTVLRTWAELAAFEGVSQHRIKHALRVADMMEEWKREQLAKPPPSTSDEPR